MPQKKPAASSQLLLRAWLRLRVPIVVAAAILMVAGAHRPWFAIGASVSFLGELLQLWCFASLRKNKELVIRGPYTVLRNPMYLGRFFVIMGFVLLLGNLWLVGIYAVCYFAYMSFRVPQEEAVLRKLYPVEYEAYCKKVNRFMPRLIPTSVGRLWYFNWDLFIKNHGGWNAVGVLAFYAAVAARLYLMSN